MSLPWHASHRASHIPRLLRTQCRRSYADSRPFAVGDHVVLRPTVDRSASPVLRGPLKHGKRIETHKGIIQQDDIIGKRVRELVRTAPTKSGKDGSDFRIHEVTLDEYVRFSRRLVTPIYPADANLIVSLLDLHPEVYDAERAGEGKLEILEAGTGHGGLTIHLSRAIHAGNPPTPKVDPEEDVETTDTKIAEWKERRQAVLHTIDVASQYSAHARQTIAAFRHGQYLHNIDFHTGSASDWVASAFSDRNKEPFLSHAFLDLPNADTHIDNVAKAVKVDGTLIVFNPSITQINECALKIKQEGIPLDLDRVIELGVNGGSGGREWDVRPVKPRAQKVQVVSESATTDGEDAQISSDDASRDAEQEQADSVPAQDASVGQAPNEGKWAMVCRPKVGDRVVGGGFLGVFRKKHQG
jgi:tRNA (adenine57-N1/adenine58-N1)-methyltransferase